MINLRIGATRVVVGWKTVEKKELVRNYKPRWWSWGGVTKICVNNAAV
jgi:hypothetical protein